MARTLPEVTTGPRPGAFGRFRSHGISTAQAWLVRQLELGRRDLDHGCSRRDHTVAAGETIDTIARRYGVPASVIMQANKARQKNSLCDATSG